jgi:hypothetical protein
MSTASRNSTIPAPLNQRIREAEQQLAGRQRSLGICTAALGRNLRETLSSPLTLVVAAGAGFAIGKFSKRKRAEPRAERDPPSARPSIFVTLIDAITLAGTLVAMLPAIRREPVRATEATGDAR